jgi:hypothetical protein
MVHLGVRPQIHARCQLSRKPRGSCVSSSLHVDNKNTLAALISVKQSFLSFPSRDQLRTRVIGTTLGLSTSAVQEDHRCRVAAGLGMKVGLLVGVRSLVLPGV